MDVSAEDPVETTEAPTKLLRSEALGKLVEIARSPTEANIYSQALFITEDLEALETKIDQVLDLLREIREGTR